MNEQEIQILNYIKNHGSFERPVPLKLLKSEFELSERGIKEIIERNAGLMPYKEQILTSQKTVTAITSVNLAEYWKGWQV